MHALTRPSWLGRTMTLGLIAGILVACTTTGQSNANNSPIPIGLVAPLTGRLAAVGSGMAQGAELAVDAVNKAGGVNGRQVQLFIQDDAADAGDATAAASFLINVDHVVAIVGPLSLTAGVVLPLASRANIPHLMFGGGSAFDTVKDPHFFRMSPSDTEQAQAMALYAHSKGLDSVALAFTSDETGQALVPSLQASTKKLGMTVVSNTSFTPGLTSYRSQIQQVFAGNPQVVISQLDDQTSGVVFGEVAQQGLLKTPWIGSNAWDNAAWFKSVGAKVAAGPITIIDSGSAGLTGTAAFTALVQAKYNTALAGSGAIFMYDGVTSWALGADVAGTTSWPQVLDGIMKAANPPGTTCSSYAECLPLVKAGTDINWSGAASTVDFDQYHNVYGPFAAVHFDAAGNSSLIADIPADQIQSAFK